MRKTKIICTMGPAIADEKILEDMIKNGLDCVRFNFSHGTREEKQQNIDLVKKVREKLKRPIPILLDTRGPEIRVMYFKDGSAKLKKNQIFTLDNNQDELGDENRVSISFEKLYKDVKKGTRILIDDGNIEMTVLESSKNGIKCKVLNDAIIKNRKSINTPGVMVDMPYISQMDHDDILFGIKNDFDYIAASFVKSAKDIKAIKKILKDNNAENIQIISKIECLDGVNNLEEILNESQGVMIARGDLGVELAFEEIPAIQKHIISSAIKAGKIVITATQMLESMISHPRPTRAEVSDVANAIYDGTTATMLSGETAMGANPVESVKYMSDIIIAAEAKPENIKKFIREELTLEKNIIDTTCLAACYAADYIQAKAIIIVTRSGRTTKNLSSFRPNCPIISLTVDEKSRRQLNIYYDVFPYPKSMFDSLEEITIAAKESALESKIVKEGDYVVIVIGSQIIEGHPSDTVRIAKL